MKMIRVGHLRTTAVVNGNRIAVEEYGDWLPVAQIAAFKSGYTYGDPPSGSGEQPLTSLVWVASIETVDGTIYEAPSPEVAREWHREVLGADPAPAPELPSGQPTAFLKSEMTVEKWPASGAGI